MRRIVVAFFMLLYFGCQNPNFPMISVTIQIKDFSPEEIKMLDLLLKYPKVIQGGYEEYKYCVPGYVTFNWKVTDKWKNRAILTDLLLTNHWYKINAEPDAIYEFEGWEVEAGKADFVEFQNVNNASMNIRFKHGVADGKITLTAKLKRRTFVLPYIVGNGFISPVAISDVNLNSLYKSLLQMEARGIDLAAIDYPSIDEQNRIIKSPENKTYKDFLDYIKTNIDITKDNYINFYDDKLDIAKLENFLLGKYNVAEKKYYGWNAGLFFFGNMVNQLKPGNGLPLQLSLYSSSFHNYIFSGWEFSPSIDLPVADLTKLHVTPILKNSPAGDDGGIIIAKIYAEKIAITVDNAGNGGATLDATTPSPLNEGQEFIITVTPDAGYVFDKWEIVSGSKVFIYKDSVDPNKFTGTISFSDYDDEGTVVLKAHFKTP